jgi:hypothetical protein
MEPDPVDSTPGAAFLPRRAVLAGLAGAGAVVRPFQVAAGAPITPAGGLAFRILRGDRQVGTHRITFSRTGERLAVAVAIDIAVRIGPLTLFRLTHRATEVWQGPVFERIDSRTDNDGRTEWMWAIRQDGFVLVDGSDGSGRIRAPEGALPATYWNPAVLAGPMLDAQTGRLLRTNVTAGAVEDIDVAGGRVRARRYVLTDDADLEIWYDLGGNWAHMQMRRAGSLITYERA